MLASSSFYGSRACSRRGKPGSPMSSGFGAFCFGLRAHSSPETTRGACCSTVEGLLDGGDQRRRPSLTTKKIMVVDVGSVFAGATADLRSGSTRRSRSWPHLALEAADHAPSRRSTRPRGAAQPARASRRRRRFARAAPGHMVRWRRYHADLRAYQRGFGGDLGRQLVCNARFIRPDRLCPATAAGSLHRCVERVGERRCALTASTISSFDTEARRGWQVIRSALHLGRVRTGPHGRSPHWPRCDNGHAVRPARRNADRLIIERAPGAVQDVDANMPAFTHTIGSRYDYSCLAPPARLFRGRVPEAADGGLARRRRCERRRVARTA